MHAALFYIEAVHLGQVTHDEQDVDDWLRAQPGTDVLPMWWMAMTSALMQAADCCHDIAGAPLLPVMAGLTLYAFWRSTVKTLRQGGVHWRGTFYPICSLKGQSGFEGLS